jgi:hypothetical protein
MRLSGVLTNRAKREHSLHLCVAPPDVVSALCLSITNNDAPHLGQSRHDAPASHLPRNRFKASTGVVVLKQRGQAATSALEIVHRAEWQRREIQLGQKNKFG